MKLNKTIRLRGWIFLCFILFTGFVNAQFEKGPKAIIQPLTYDFGDILQDSVVTIYFVITNEGSEILKITKVNASCGCTAVMPEKNELKPGESTNIKATFDSKGRAGKQNKIITVETNEPENSSLKVTLTGNVIKDKSSAEFKNKKQKTK